MVRHASMSTAVPLGAAVPSLARWGMSVDADLVYRTLVTFGERAERTLAAELGMPRRRVSEAVAELAAAGAVMASTDGGTSNRAAAVWHPRRPADVITTLRTRRLRLVDPVAQATAHRQLLRALVRRTSMAGVALDPADLVGIAEGAVRALPSRALTRARLTELRAFERHDRLVINNEQTYDAEMRTSGSAGNRSVVERNIHARVLSVPPADGDQFIPGEEYVNQTTYQWRESLAVPLKLFVIDHRVALFPIDPADVNRGYFEVSHRPIVDGLVAVFEEHWATSTDPTHTAVPQILLSERESALVELLAAGHTDITAAEQLRISARSVTNILRALMDRLGVDNRFQLGLTLGTMRAAAPPSLNGLRENAADG